MMIKYRVHDVAKDLDVPNKEVLDILGKYVKEPKKHMTALEENELDIVFDRFTQDHAAQNFDAYFATRNAAKTEEKPAEKTAEKPSEKTAKNTQEPKKQNVNNNNNRNKNNDRRNNNGNNRNQNAQQNKPQRPAQNNQPSNNTPAQEAASEAPRRRVVDTRTVNVNIDKYNEKYDRLAYDKVKNDTVAAKQKINQKSQRRGKPRSAKRETEAERLNRIAAERKAKAITITVPDEITVGEFALRLKATSAEVIKKLMANGVFATINDTIDFDTAVLIADEFHAKVEKEVVVTIEDRIIDDSEDDDANLVPRAPVVVVMGHVDHGKTSILDAIRKTNVTAGEAGGITQAIGAYQVKVNDSLITFLDTPGHEAFTSMRARGANMTDIAVLVVAADDGIMPQTIESINHAKAANVKIIVAMNKMDKPTANPERVMEGLTKYGIITEDWGGDVACIPVSALTGMGINDLLERIALEAEVMELKANPNRRAKGVVIEARLDKARGPVATLLVQNGTLKQGDIVIAGTAVGRVRVMTNDKGRTVKTAGPSVPVEITGLADVPTPGDEFNAVTDERMARELVEQRRQAQKDALAKMNQKVTLDNLFAKMQEGEMKELPLIVKADVQGSAEALKSSLEKISNEEVRVRVIHAGVGAINESDILLASTAGAIVVGFNVRPDAAAAASAHRANVDMRFYRVIYDAIDEIEAAMKGMLAPKFEEVVIGHAEVRMTYKVSAIGTIAGCMVKDGKVTRDSQVRVLRDNIVIHEGEIGSLQRFKDAVKEVTAGYECGMSVVKYNDIKEGDIFECFVMQEVKR